MIRDTDPDCELLGPCCLVHIKTLLSFYQIDRWHRFELLLVYVGCMYPVGCRDLDVVIKINTLEEVSSVGACYLLY